MTNANWKTTESGCETTTACAHGAANLKPYKQRYGSWGIVFCHDSGVQCCTINEGEYDSKEEAQRAIDRKR